MGSSRRQNGHRERQPSEHLLHAEAPWRAVLRLPEADNDEIAGAREQSLSHWRFPS